MTTGTLIVTIAFQGVLWAAAIACLVHAAIDSYRSAKGQRDPMRWEE